MKKRWILLLATTALFSAFVLNIAELPLQTSTLFSGSGTCVQCHSSTLNVLTTMDGKDVSPHKWWRSTMMANASKDPYWRAKVSAEVDAHPSLQAIIEDKCLTCHAPMGRTEALFLGQEPFSMTAALADPLSIDGVSCTVCHQVSNENLGQTGSFSGGYIIKNDRKIYGPYEGVFLMPMINNVNYTPLYGPQVKESALCATCHTLFTPYLDDDLNIAGYFPEQTPYLEWLNSIYPAEGKSCQSCHMPAINETMKISSLPPNLVNTWNPVWEHEFVGGNQFMGKVLKENAIALGVNASAAELDSTISRSASMLKDAIRLNVNAYFEEDSLVIEVLLENLTGHKFPTGFPSRRAWIHLKVMDGGYNTRFESGEYSDAGDIPDEDENYEPHHNVITDPSQVQLYEAVMGDVNDEPTYTLLRGAKYLKDNRLLPQGYLSGTLADTATGTFGLATADPDFNFSGTGEEGSGSDKVYYKIPEQELEGGYVFEVELLYQPVSPGFVHDLDKHETILVNDFLNMHEQADKLPYSLADQSGIFLEDNLTELKDNQSFSIFPNPVKERFLVEFPVHEKSVTEISLLDMNGRLVRKIFQAELLPGEHKVEVILEEPERQNSTLIVLLRIGGKMYSRKLMITP